ncbi:MAG: hypothetical protein HY909_17570 [Deltaproteobacteria bacterium]|nr:hypothetical protein [Deltaproteobacteria bacterium]
MRTSGSSMGRACMLLVLLGCSARGASGGTFSPPPEDAAATETGSTPGQCERSCTSLVACLGTIVGTMGQCVSTCQTSSVTAACHQCVQTSCAAGCGMSCSACLTAGGPCELMGTPPRDGGVTPPPPPPPPGGCSATNCSTCTARSNCGWCNNRCYVGTSSGPTGASCGASPWAWTSSMCGGSPPPPDGGGVFISPMCRACATEACASVGSACVSDSMCLECFTANPVPPACASNPRFNAVIECSCGTCRSACSTECAAIGM